MAPSLPASAVLRSFATREYLSYVGGVANAEETFRHRDKPTLITPTTDAEDKYNFVYILFTLYSYIKKNFRQWWRPRPPSTLGRPTTSVNQESKSSSTSLGFVSAREKNIFNPMAKIAVEKSKTNSNYVHLRFPHANKYLVRRGGDMIIVASSGQPDEDRSKLSCTLFEPVAESNGTFSLRHVQSGLPVRVGTIEPYVYLDETATVKTRSFTFVDWETLVMLPKHVAFKGYNDRYLQAVIRDGYYHYLESSSTDRYNQNTFFEITTNPDGSVRIWSLDFEKFWRRSPNWIWADSTDQTGNDIDTLFWPVKLTNDTIALRNAGNNRFCKPLTTDGKTLCLNADATISNLSYLKVEELVLERNIFNVRYNVDDARIHDDETPTVAGFGSATNTSGQPATLTIKVAYEDVTSSTFTNTVSIITGVKTDIKAGVPLIADGKIVVSTEVTNSLEWNRPATKTRTAEALYSVVVPPNSSARVTFVATRGTCSVPFTYTQRDKLFRDGSFVTSHHIDGIYTGVNYYSFRFEKHEITPL